MHRKKISYTMALYLTVLALTIFLLFTRFYSIGYILLIVLTSSRLTHLSTFSSRISRLILGGMLLAATIMITGIGFWLLKTPLSPPVIGVSYLVLIVFIAYKKPFPKVKPKRAPMADGSDYISILTSLIAPLILISSFGVSAPAALQIANEGWDNGSHVLMLESSAIYNSYLYGKNSEIQPKIINYDSNAYPQAWHLSSGHILSGFGSNNVLNPLKPIRTTFVYIAVLLLWLMLASYLVTKISIFVGKHVLKRAKLSPPELLTLLAASISIQCVVLWGSFNSGFSNYIGMLAYIMVIVAMFLEDSHKRSAIKIALVAATAAALSWFLPLPAIFVALFILIISSLKIKKIKDLFARSNRSLVGFYFLALSICLGQAFIFVLFSRISGGNQLNEGVAIDPFGYVNGVFPVSQLFFGITVLSTIWLFSRQRLLVSKKVVSMLIIPFIILSVFMYGYQQISNGYSSYYLPKTIGIALLPLSVFSAPLFAFWLHQILKKYRLRNYASFGVSVAVIGFVFLITNQSLYGVSHLLEKNTRVNRSTSAAVVNFLENVDQKNNTIIVMRDDPKKPYEDRNGRFEMRVVHQKLNCAYTIRNSSRNVQEWIDRLENCARRQQKFGGHITVVTSEKTTPLIKALNLNNVTIVEVPLVNH